MGAQQTLITDINEELIQIRNLLDSPQDLELSKARMLELHSKIKKAISLISNSVMTEPTKDNRDARQIIYKERHFAESMTKSGHYFINNPSDGISALPEDSLNPGFMTVYINPLSNIHFYQFISIVTSQVYNFVLDKDNIPSDIAWSLGGGGDAGASEASSYQFLLASSNFSQAYVDILNNDDHIVGTATLDIIKSQVTGTVGQKIATNESIINDGNSYDEFFIYQIAIGTNLKMEYSVDGGINWLESIDGQVKLDTPTADFRVRFEWLNADSKLSSFGVLFEKDSTTPQSSTRLFKKYEVLEDKPAGFIMQIPDGRHYNNDGKSLIVHKNRLRMWIDVDYREISSNSIEWIDTLLADDSIIVEEQYGSIDTTDENKERIAALEITYKGISSGYNAHSNEFIFADTTTGAYAVSLPADPLIGDSVTIHDVKSNFDIQPLLVIGNGNTIMGLNEDTSLNIKHSTVKFIFSQNDWRII